MRAPRALLGGRGIDHDHDGSRCRAGLSLRTAGV